MLCSVRVLTDNHIFTYRDTVQKKRRELGTVKNTHPATKEKGLTRSVNGSNVGNYLL